MHAAAAEPRFDVDELVRRVLAHFRSPRYQPPLLPVIAVEIMALSQDPDASTHDMVEVLAKDPLLSAKVLQRAQSAAYAGRSPVRNLQDAVARLGTKALRDIVFEVSLNTRVFQSPLYTEPMERLRVHSVAAAHIARIVCEHTQATVEYAFLAGLLHDVGVAGMFIALAESPERPAPELVWPAIREVHEDASRQLASLWRLPRDLVAVLGAHHSVVVDGKPSELAAVLVVADRLAFELAPLVGADPSTAGRPRAMPGKDLSEGETVKQACAVLRIDGAKWRVIRDASAACVAEVV